MKIRVLVTDGENRSSLAVTRSLGEKGCYVAVTGIEKRNLAAASKYCSKGYSVPDPFLRATEYGFAIMDIAKKEKIDVIFPMTDVSIQLLNELRDQFPAHIIVGCTTSDMMMALSNKFELFKLAKKLNVPIPTTYYITDITNLDHLVNEIVKYPVVIKPSLSRRPYMNGFLSGPVTYANSQEELIALYKKLPALKYSSIVQEKIIGPGTGLFTLYDKDRHLALFSHRRLMEKPPSGGVSVVSESVPLDEEMVESSSKLLSAVEWTGIAMVEFKRDQRDGKAKLIEVNGRFWGSLQLSITCGVDFPLLYLNYLEGKKPSTTINYFRLSHKMKWIFGILDHLLILIKDNKERRSLFDGASTQSRHIYDCLKIFEKNTSFDVANRNDLGPFMFELRNYILQILRGR